MYNTSLRILNDRTEAEDVMQDSFLMAFRKIDEYSGEGDFGAWLRRIVVNNSIDALKKRRQWILPGDENLGEDEPEETQTEDTEYKIAEIKSAMGTLPEQHRVIISLFLFEGYDHGEISEILGISYNNSRTRYSRARQKLLEVLSVQRKLSVFHPN